MHPLRIAGTIVLLVLLAGFLLYRPGLTSARKVVIYSSVDSDVALPIFTRFTKETGIPVEYRLDGEETKTTGLALRLAAMKGHPDGDVFWNSEESFSDLLAQQGIVEAVRRFDCRVRVVIYNREKVKAEEAPQSLEDFSAPRWKGRFAVAKPLYGTTRSHLVALVSVLGEEKAFALFRAWRANGVIVAESNSDVRDRVADGTCDVGLTDNDDAQSALDRGKPVGFRLLNQTRDWPGAFYIPNTVSLLAGAPHPEEGRRFMDFLMNQNNAQQLIDATALSRPFPPPGEIQHAQYDRAKVAASIMEEGDRIYRVLSGEIP